MPLPERINLFNFGMTKLVNLGVTGAIGLGADHDWAVMLGMVSWGTAFGALPVCVKIRTRQAAPEGFERGDRHRW